MPSEPIDMPSETVIVLKVTALPRALFTPWATWLASSLMWILQGVTSLQVEAMPICGFLKSLSLKPTARSMARLGARVTPSTTTDECCLVFLSFSIIVAVASSCGRYPERQRAR